jgi:hypothetical protein
MKFGDRRTYRGGNRQEFTARFKNRAKVHLHENNAAVG